MKKIVILAICIMIADICLAYGETRLERDSDKCAKEIELNLSECRKAIKITLDQKSSTDSLKEDVNALLFCRHPLVKEKLTAQEQENVNFIWSRAEKAKGTITKKEIYDLDGWASRFLADCVEPYKDYSRQELDKLDDLLKKIWSEMIKAISDNNTGKAASFFIEPKQDEMKEFLEALNPDQRREFVRDLQSGQIVMERIRGSEAIYDITITRNGKKNSAELSFGKNINGTWKIVSF